MVPGEWVPERMVVMGYSHCWNPGLNKAWREQVSLLLPSLLLMVPPIGRPKARGPGSLGDAISRGWLQGQRADTGG